MEEEGYCGIINTISVIFTFFYHIIKSQYVLTGPIHLLKKNISSMSSFVLPDLPLSHHTHAHAHAHAHAHTLTHTQLQTFQSFKYQEYKHSILTNAHLFITSFCFSHSEVILTP